VNPAQGFIRLQMVKVKQFLPVYNKPMHYDIDPTKIHKKLDWLQEIRYFDGNKKTI